MRPRIRTVKPEMRQDERYARLSYPARELFNGLITMADDEGRFRALSSAILGHVFPYDEDDAPESLKGWVGEIKDSGMVLFYLAEQVPYGAFRRWARHQKINRPTPSELPPPPSPKVVRENGLTHTERGWKQSLSLTDSSVNAHGDLTEASLNETGEVTDSSVSPHSSPRGRAFRSDPSPVVELCQRLAARVRANDPKAHPDPLSARWMTDMRLLLGDRGGDVEEVERLIDWCQSDSFWRCNVLSPGSLRKQFTRLVLRAKGGEVVPLTAARPSPSELLRAMNFSDGAA